MRLSQSAPESAATPSLVHSTAAIEAAFQANCVRFQYCFVDLIAEQLADSSRAFKGDMQKEALIAIIGQVTLRAMVAASTSARTIQEMPSEWRGISTFRLADAAGIPRETVRRKPVSMERMGWLKREANFWFLTFHDADATARHDLLELDNRSVNRAARFCAAVMPLLAVGGQPK